MFNFSHQNGYLPPKESNVLTISVYLYDSISNIFVYNNLSYKKVFIWLMYFVWVQLAFIYVLFNAFLLFILFILTIFILFFTILVLQRRLVISKMLAALTQQKGTFYALYLTFIFKKLLKPKKIDFLFFLFHSLKSLKSAIKSGLVICH